MQNVSVDEVAITISKALEEYRDLSADELKKACKRAAKTVREEIQSNAPRRTGKYAKSWTVRTVSETSGGVELIVHSKDRYMIAHLLENGHAKRGGGRVRAIPHIKPAEEKGIKQLEDDITKALQKG